MKNERFDTVEDLINSDLFCEWVQNQQHKTFWQEWQANNAERQALVEEASAFIKKMAFQKESIPAAEMGKALTTLWSTIEKQPKATSPIINNKQIQLFTPKKGWRIAASILFLIAASWLTWQYTTDDVMTYATAYGETEALILPDGSQVVLQANSTLKVPKDWAKKSKRKVWLEGQAFFNVTKLATTTPIKFTVQTNDFNVEVLGTQFDVLSRPNSKRVVLQEGKIRMEFDNNHLIDLQPNEMATYAVQTKGYKKSTIKAANFIAWTNNKLILDNTPLREIARILTQNYGYQVNFSTNVNQEQNRSTIGAIPINNVDDLIAVTEASYEVNITKEGQRIKIQ